MEKTVGAILESSWCPSAARSRLPAAFSKYVGMPSFPSDGAYPTGFTPSETTLSSSRGVATWGLPL